MWLYSSFWTGGHRTKTRHRKYPKSLVYATFGLYLLFLGALTYGGFTIFRASKIYLYVKNNNTMVSCGIFEYNPVLGFSPKPNSEGKEMFVLPPDVPLYYDSNSLRVAEKGAEEQHKRPIILALGCSFTHGDACLAQDTYPYIVGEKLGGSCLNAGFFAYGLSQMLIRARELIPRFKPDYVIVQYSPWLVMRSMNQFAPTVHGKRPQPYFVQDSNGKLILHPPVFSTTFDEPFVDYRGYDKSLGDFSSFLIRAGIPFYIKEDSNEIAYRFRNFMHKIPEPANNRNKVVEHVYNEISELCDTFGAKMIVCIIGSPLLPPNKRELAILKNNPNIILADAWSALLESIPTHNIGSYDRHYAHYRGIPAKLIDRHPNAVAHKIIAAEILKQIQEWPALTNNTSR